MKKLIASVIVAVAALVPTVSQAQSYSAAVAKQSRCSAVGALWQEHHERGTIRGKTVKEYTAAAAAGTASHAVVVSYIIIAASAPHGQKYNTPQDAYMAGWADCMDGK